MSDLTAVAGGTYEVEVIADAGATVGIRVLDTPAGTVVRARTTTGWTLTALADATVLYSRTETADPAWQGTYVVEVDDGARSGTQTLTVTTTPSTAGAIAGSTWPPPVADLIVLNPAIPMDTTQDLVNDVARLVERYTGRTYEAGTGVRSVIADGTAYLTIPDVRAVTAVSIVDRYGASWDPAPGYRLTPASTVGWPSRELDLGVVVRAGSVVQVTGDWGWTPAPELAVRGLAEWVASLLATDETPTDADGRPITSETLEAYGVQFSVPDPGSEPAGTASGSGTPPPEARRWLDPLRVGLLPMAV